MSSRKICWRTRDIPYVPSRQPPVRRHHQCLWKADKMRGDALDDDHGLYDYTYTNHDSTHGRTLMYPLEVSWYGYRNTVATTVGTLGPWLQQIAHKRGNWATKEWSVARVRLFVSHNWPGSQAWEPAPLPTRAPRRHDAGSPRTPATPLYRPFWLPPQVLLLPTKCGQSGKMIITLDSPG